uniref:Uncharacterized protein n=1 Tax=Oreochromis aureus TaxID=47969 RepID=A0AAZ1XHK5_OREAU
MIISIALIWAVVVGFCCLLWLAFGANPLQFLRSQPEVKYGHIFTCKIAGKYIHFYAILFSYHSVIRQEGTLDWRKFHFATSVKALGHDNTLSPSRDHLAGDGIFAFCYKMFESGYLTLLGKELGEDKCQARQEAQKKLWCSMPWRTSKNLTKSFRHLYGPTYSRALPYHCHNLAKTMHAGTPVQERRMSDLISMRMILNDSLSTFNDISKARTHVVCSGPRRLHTLPRYLLMLVMTICIV